MNSSLVTLYNLVKHSEPKCPRHQSWDNHDYFIGSFTGSSNAGKVLSTAQAYFVLLHFALLSVTDIAIFTN